MTTSVSTPRVQGWTRPPAPRPLEIRRARLEEMGTIAGFVRSSADWYRPIVDDKDMGQHEVDDSWARDNFLRRDFYIAQLGGTPIGTISTQLFGDWAYLGYIYLDVDYVGQGHGRRLINFARDVVTEQGAVGMSLIAHPEAVWAKRAYLKYGFRIAETRKPDVLAWQDGALEPYYEEGFELYLYDLDNEKRAHA